MASHMPSEDSGLTPVEGRSYTRWKTPWTCVKYNPTTGYVKLSGTYGTRVMGIGTFRAQYGTFPDRSMTTWG